jgi:hypothetical protein
VIFPGGILQGTKPAVESEQRTVVLTYLCSRRDPTGPSRAFLAHIYLSTEFAPLTKCRIRHSPPGDPSDPCHGLRRQKLSGLGDAASDAPDLAGAQVLYVGGRAHQVPQLKALVERAGGSWWYRAQHDAAARPDRPHHCTMFPIDCISHDAMGTVKRQCRLSGTPY